MSKGFQFPLQKVLEYRESQKNAEAMNLSKSKSKLANEQGKMNQMEQEKGKAINGKSSGKSVTILNLRLSSDYIVQINNDIEKQGEVVKSTEDIVEIDRQKLLDAAKEHQAVEILRDKQKANFNKELKKRELKQNDEKTSIKVHFEKRNER